MKRLLASNIIPLLVITVGVLAVCGLLNSYHVYVLTLTLIYAVAAIGLVVLSGYGGQMSLGTAALIAIGAYGAGILMNEYGWNFIPAGIAGALAATILGTLLAAPALRLTGMHIAIVTLAFGVIVVQMIGKGGPLTGGMAGLSVPSATILGVPINSDTSNYVLSAVVFLGAYLTTRRFLGLKPGRALLALHEHEPTARAMGINTKAYKILAFAVSSFLAGLSGVLYGNLKGFITVDDFTIWTSIYFFVMIVVGGMRSVNGAVIGAAVVVILPELLRDLKESADAVFGILLMLIIIFIPDGLLSLPERIWAGLSRLNLRGRQGQDVKREGAENGK